MKPGTVWLLKKALYGLKQAGLEWFKTLWNHIKSIGYSQSGYDPCLYVKDSNHFVIIYVDDLLLFSTIMRITNEKKELTRCYEMHDLCEAKWFLAMEISWDRVEHMIMIDQCKYIRKILTHFGLHNSKPVSTLMATNLKLPALETSTVDQ